MKHGWVPMDQEVFANSYQRFGEKMFILISILQFIRPFHSIMSFCIQAWYFFYRK